MTRLDTEARTAVIFDPPADIAIPHSRQVAEGFRFHTANVKYLSVIAPSEARRWIETYLPDVSVQDPSVLKSDEFDAIVFTIPRNETKFYVPPFVTPSSNASSKWKWPFLRSRSVASPQVSSLRFYIIDWNGRLSPLAREYDDQDALNMDAHIFNRLSKPEAWGFYYFPYGYLFRYPGMGPLNQFGFRVPDDLSNLKNRAANHKLVLCYGGSTGFSMYTLPHQMYPAVIECALNKKALETGADVKFTVLNFGQHGHVVMNSILTYTLFNYHLKPDFVVGHDGWNDILYGMVQDPRILKDGNVAYQNNLEGWSQILHGTSQLQQTQAETPFRAMCAAPAVLGQYFSRKRQLEAMVEANGGKFIWGLQPNWAGKGRLHPLESANVEAFKSHTPFTEVTQMALPLFERASLQLEKLDVVKVDLYKEFRKYGEDDYLFVDTVHLSPDGDEIVGKAYANVIAGLCGLNKKGFSNEPNRDLSDQSGGRGTNPPPN